jgi:hypothetical protein
VTLAFALAAGIVAGWIIRGLVLRKIIRGLGAPRVGRVLSDVLEKVDTDELARLDERLGAELARRHELITAARADRVTREYARGLTIDDVAQHHPPGSRTGGATSP